MSKKPTPRVVTEVCDLCGLDWRLHGDNPTTETCIKLLAAEVRRLESQLALRPISFPVPYPQPYPVPRPWPYYPRPIWTTIGNTSSSASGNYTPALSNITPRALTA